jgi:endonuclease/exonuclease/phosphatase family metal-dependent hydrolase
MGVPRQVLAASACATLAVTAVLSARSTEAGRPRLAAATNGAVLRVASFNISGVNGDAHATGDHEVWRKRRPGVVAAIVRNHIDVVGVQEANQSTIYAGRLADGANQYLDLKAGLRKAGRDYRLTTKAAYNCVRPFSSRNCTPKYRGASGDNRILYDAGRVAMVSSGSVKFAHQNPGKNPRYVQWAVFKMRSTGAKFLFTNTHLDPYSEAIRKAQWHDLIGRINKLKGSLPVVAVGDFNTSKFDKAAATMLPAMKAAGYGDVLNQQYRVNPPHGVRAATLRHGWVGSFNGYRRDVRRYGYESARDKVGNNIDYVFASNRLRVQAWGTVLKLNRATLRVNGVIPSDHNMVRATLVLP